MSVRLSFRPSVCLSVCLSVRHTEVLCLNGYAYPHFFFTIGYSPTILVLSHQKGWQYSDRDPLTGASNARGMKKSRFSTNISLYLGNDARWSHSYYGRFIGNCTQAFEWYRLEWSWVISNPDFKVTYHSTSNNSKTVPDRAIFTTADQ